MGRWGESGLSSMVSKVSAVVLTPIPGKLNPRLGKEGNPLAYFDSVGDSIVPGFNGGCQSGNDKLGGHRAWNKQRSAPLVPRRCCLPVLRGYVGYVPAVR